ncbi:MAG TPA: DUF4097 family beta strand repeat-containing protein [Oscillospiraceae bacterium]|nr:DUF4097 family beta strand repeat-containing protein [Oscillospiraceae bacterium]
MNKETFLRQLSALISDLPDNERATILDFYREIIEDKMEGGVSEAEAVASLGDVYQLSQKILSENPNRKPRHKNRTGVIVLCSVLGFLLIAGIITSLINIPRFTIYAKDANNSAVQGKIIINGKSVTNLDNEQKTFTAKAAGVTKIKLRAENKSIHITPSDNDEIRINYVSNENQTYKFSSDGGIVSMDNYDSQYNFSLFDFNFSGHDDETINVEVPAQYANDISIETTNSEIVVTNLKKLHDVTCSTTNSAINLSDICVNNANIHTKNAVIAMKNVEAQASLEALTKNAKISLDKIVSPDITLKTENGIITGTISGREEDYAIDSSTTNGVNNLRNRSDGSKKLTVETTNAIISVSFSNP